jgi:bacillithiol biosynthesis deacetylase BshB1
MRILAFGIHPDDIELGCGGTVCLAAQAGNDVILADLSDGASASNGTPKIRAVEAAAAARILGVKDRVNLGLPDTEIRSEDPDQIRVVVRCIREARPDLIMYSSADDPHPDHAAGGVLIERAVYFAGVKGYLKKVPACRVGKLLAYPGRRELEPDVVFDITSVYETKVRAIEAHETQFIADEGRNPTPLNSPEFLPFIEARCRMYGRAIGVRYGEPFELQGPLALADFGVFQG